MTIKEWWEKNKPIIEERMTHPLVAGSECGRCYYRKDENPDNLAPENCCFIGAAITPEEYKLHPAELMNADAKLEEIGVKFSEGDLGVDQRESVNSLQRIHDFGYPQFWKLYYESWKNNHESYLTE